MFKRALLGTALVLSLGTGLSAQTTQHGGIEVVGVLDQRDFVTFTDADTTPSVLNANHFKEANTGATNITALDDGLNGQSIFIACTTTNTTFVDGGNLSGMQGNFVCVVGGALSLEFDGTTWIERGRSPIAPGGAPPNWEDLTNTANTPTSYLGNTLAEVMNYDFQANYTAEVLFNVTTTVGTPSGGVLANFQVHDADVTVFRAWDGTDGVQVSGAGAFGIVGSGTITATDLAADTLAATTEILGTLCGTNQILEDQGAAWACINTPSGGAGSQHQVDAVNVTTNDPINFRDTTTISASNPSAGNIDFDVNQTANFVWTGQHDYDTAEILSAIPIRFEGLTDDNVYTTITITDPTVGRTFVLPNADSNSVQPLTCTGDDKVSAISGLGVITCSTDQTAGGANWEAITNLANTATLYTGDNNAETFTINFTSNWSTDRFIVSQGAGNPSTGTLMRISYTDTDIIALEIDDGTDTIIAESGIEGVLVLTPTGAAEIHATEVIINVQKGSAGTITKGQAVYQSGYDAVDGVIEVELADSDASATMPAIGIAEESITDTASGHIVAFGSLDGVNTSSFSTGDDLYISGTAGDLTNTKPTGTGLIQRIAQVGRSHVSLGAIEISGAGRENDLPNIANDNIWIGDGSGVPAASIITDCTDTGGNHLNYTQSTNAFSCGTSLPSTVVETNQSNTYTTGDQSFASASSLTVPTAAGAAPTSSGDIRYDTTSFTLEHGDNGVNRLFANLDEAQTFTNKTHDDPLFSTQVRFTAVAAPSYAAGQLFYDSTDQALAFHNDESDVTLQIGQEEWVRARNETGSTITNGQVVYVDGIASGLPRIALARANAMATSEVVGIVTHDIENLTNGYVTASGLVRDFNTSSFTIGDRVYLSPSVAGALTATAPSDPNFVVPVGIVTEVNATTGDVLVTLGAPRRSGGSGIAVVGNELRTASTEEGFLNAGVLSCGANTAGSMRAHTTPLQYCDDAATPALQYAAYGASDGDALAGDSATSFFDTGTIEATRLPSAAAATLGVIELDNALGGTASAVELAAGVAGDGIALNTATAPDSLDVDLLTVQDGTGVAFSFSGMEFGGAGSDKLTLLQGCVDNEILKWDDEAGGNGRWDCATDVSGGTPLWSDLGDPTSAMSMTSSSITELMTWDYQANYTTEQLVLFKTSVGTPSGGTLLTLQVHDTDVTPFVINDGTNNVVTIARNADSVFRNFADAATELKIDSGSTTGQSSRLTFADRGTNEWRFAKGSTNAFSIEDVGVGFRLVYNPAGDTLLSTGSTTSDFVFRDITPTERGRILGDADTYCYGSAQTACISKATDPNSVVAVVQSAGSVFGLPVIASDPNTATWGTGQDGRIWFNSTGNEPKYWDGAAIQTFGGTDGVGYDEIMEEGAGLTKRAIVNYIGANMTCVDNPGSSRTDCTISGAGGNLDLLDGSTHQDTTAGTVLRGDIITGQTATPEWTRLTVGAVNTLLGSDGTDVAWTTSFVRSLQVDANPVLTGAIVIATGTGLSSSQVSQTATIKANDAATGVKGVLALDGDLGGTSSSPSVLQVNGVAVASTTPADGECWVYDGVTDNRMEPGSCGGGVAWNALTDPTAAVTMNSNANAELVQFNYTSALGATDVAFQIEQLTGDPVAGSILLELVAADTDILLLSAGSGANTIDVTQAGAMSAQGTATITATDLAADAIDATTEFAASLCGVNQILERQAAVWACIATPSGGAVRWDELNDPTGAIALNSNANTELFQMNFISALGATDVAVQIEQLTGDPVAGSILLELVAADTDILLLSAGSGANTIDITQAGAMTAQGTASITATLGDNAASFFGAGELEIVRGGTGQSTANPAFNALSPVTTEGDIIYRNATVNARLARGANGECLTSSTTTILWGSCGGTPAWEALTNSADTATTYDGTALAETLDFDFQANYTSEVLYRIRTSTGTPSGGTLLSIETHDADITPFSVTNSIDSPLRVALFKSGSAANQNTYLVWQVFGAVDEWEVGMTSSQDFVIRDSTISSNRLFIADNGGNSFRVAGATSDFTFLDNSGGTQFLILGDADTTCWGTGEDTCLNRSAAGVYALTATAGSAPAADGQITYDSTADRLEFGINAVSHNVVSPSTTDTFTEKSLDVEDSGNVITTVSKIYIDGASCIGATATLNWDDAGTGDTAPTAACNDTGSIQRPSADFAGGAVNSFERTIRLPSDWASAENVDISIRYVSVAASPTGNVEWDVSTICRAAGQTWDAAFNAAQTITDAVAAQNVLNDGDQAAVTMTTCAADEDWSLKVSRDGTNDTNNDLAKLLGVTLTLRRDQ